MVKVLHLAHLGVDGGAFLVERAASAFGNPSTLPLERWRQRGQGFDGRPGPGMLVAVEGEAFELGSAMSVAVSAAVPEALRAVTTLIERNEQCA